MASIYNISSWVGGTPYKKNDIIKNSDKFWYASQDNDDSATPAVGSAYWNGHMNVTIDSTTTVEPYFSWAPSYNVSVNHEPSIHSIQFGDGYEQRIKQGINNNRLDLSLTFESRGEREAAAILHFLHAREGYGHFYFKTPKPYSLIKKFVCKSFNSTFVFADNYNIQCQFMEVS